MLNISKRGFLCILVISFLMAFFHPFYLKANATSDLPLGLRNGFYYRIKNAQTGYYLTIQNNEDSVGAQCVMLPRSASHAQQFQLAPYTTGRYRLIPRSTESGLALGLGSVEAAAHPGSYVKLQSTLNNTLLSITRRDNGYYISHYASSGVYVFGYANTDPGAIIKTATPSSPYTNWIFEPVYTGDMAYFKLTTLDADDDAAANDVVTRFGGLGYGTSTFYKPTPVQIYSTSPSRRVMVFHGHGSAGFISLDQSDDTSIYLYSEDATHSLESISGTIWSGMSFVAIISCQSARDSNERQSMVDVAYSLGANCVLGFQNNVAGGEKFLKHMADAMYNRPDDVPVTIADAIAYATYEFSFFQRNDTDHAANDENRVVLGNANICIDKRLG